jgi:Methyltransferase domain
MKRLLRNLLHSIPGLNQLLFLRGAFTGHFYSPIPSMREIQEHKETIFRFPGTLAGIDMHDEEQLRLVQIFAREYYKDHPFTDEKKEGLTYYFKNVAFTYSDGLMLHCMLRHFRPRRVVEIGSGFSSCVTLDTNRLFLNNTVECTFIDPYSNVLQTLLHGKVDGLNIIARRVQEVSMSVFTSLDDGDFLFVDSSHVSKVGSDVNHILFNILPALRPGVWVHFHDVFYPFEYPEGWIANGRSWTEAYLLRAFLEFNSAFQIRLFPNYLVRFHENFFRENMPRCLKDPGGSLWIRRNQA